MDEGADLESALTACAAYQRLEGSDRGLARAITSAALRSLGRIDYALTQLVDRPLEKIDPAILSVLRIGAAQLWTMDSPGYAAVSATVEGARHWNPARRGGALVNAVLRRATREASLFEDAPPTSVWPDWLAMRFQSALGQAGANALARLQMHEPPIDLSLKPKIEAEPFARELEGDALPNGTIRIKAGRKLVDLPGYVRGDWWVQDAGATIAANVLGDVAGKSIADICAAPGGKALQLASKGANVTAVDISGQRLKTLNENTDRTSLEMTVLEADARTWKPETQLDAVLLDAPCSALGVLRRHPEAAWSRDPNRLSKYPQTQQALVEAAHEMLKPDATLIYCVCTPLAEEGVEIIDAAVATGKWKRQPIEPAEVPGFVHAITQNGDVLTVPPIDFDQGPDDGSSISEIDVVPQPTTPETTPDQPRILSDVFYVARLVRVA